VWDYVAEVKGLVDLTSPIFKAMSSILPGSPLHKTHPNTTRPSQLSQTSKGLGSEQSSRSVRSKYCKGQKVVVKSNDDGFYYQGEHMNLDTMLIFQYFPALLFRCSVPGVEFQTNTS